MLILIMKGLKHLNTVIMVVMNKIVVMVDMVLMIVMVVIILMVLMTVLFVLVMMVWMAVMFVIFVKVVRLECFYNLRVMPSVNHLVHGVGNWKTKNLVNSCLIKATLFKLMFYIIFKLIYI